jgi:spore germination cell wall hydrolase CwlJ-like protein
MIDQALLCLATTIFMESAGEPREAQIAVGYVLMRRAEFEHKNVCSEMKRPAQFSWYGLTKPPSVIRQEYKDIAYRVLHRLEIDYSYGAFNFHDTSIEKPKSWKNLKPVVKWSNLIFYVPVDTKYGRLNNQSRIAMKDK